MTEIRGGGGKSRNEECEYFAFLNNQRLTGVGINLDNSAVSRGCYKAYDEGGHVAIPPLISETIEIFYKSSVMIVKISLAPELSNQRRSPCVILFPTDMLVVIGLR